MRFFQSCMNLVSHYKHNILENPGHFNKNLLKLVDAQEVIQNTVASNTWVSTAGDGLRASPGHDAEVSQGWRGREGDQSGSVPRFIYKWEFISVPLSVKGRAKVSILFFFFLIYASSFSSPRTLAPLTWPPILRAILALMSSSRASQAPPGRHQVCTSTHRRPRPASLSYSAKIQVK